MSESSIISVLSLVVASIAIFISYKAYKASKREGEKPVIKKIKDDFIKPTLDRLYLYKTLQEFIFPDSYNKWMGFWRSDKNFSMQWFDLEINEKAFKKFSKKRLIMGWKIKRFIKFFNSINEKIRSMAIEAMKQNKIKSIPDPDENGSIRWVLTFPKDDLDEVLRKYNLLNYMKKIEILSAKVPKKSIKLLKKLEKIEEKWEN